MDIHPDDSAETRLAALPDKLGMVIGGAAACRQSCTRIERICPNT